MNDDIDRCIFAYENRYTKILKSTGSQEQAVESCVNCYLDGKPTKRGYNHYIRSIALWKCSFWKTIPSGCYDNDFVAFALGYSLRWGLSDGGVLKTILNQSAETLKRGIRYSQLFLQPDSPSWKQVLSLADEGNDDFQQFLIVCLKLQQEVRDLDHTVGDLKGQIDELTVFESLLYSSLFTFQRVVPERIDFYNVNEGWDELHQGIFDALNEILIWKVKSRPDNDLLLNERFLTKSLKQHLMPLLLPSEKSPSICLKNLELFGGLVAAVVRRNEFMSGTVHDFCYDDDYRYRFDGNHLTLYPIEIPEESEWDFNGRKLSALHTYWFNKAVLHYAHSDLFSEQFGLPENDESNRMAFIKACQVVMQLEEVYGLDTGISLPDGTTVDLFKAIHSLELMTAFFNVSFIRKFQEHIQESGSWRAALSQLMLEGIATGENRFPLTWAEPPEKAKRIKAWTVSDANPEGDIGMAEAILKFWSNDLKKLKEDLVRSPDMPTPDVCEKPIINVGMYGFQLPWLMASQNNSNAAVNNLRRIGSRRKGRVNETHRIESRLGDLLKSQGFAVIQSYQPKVVDCYDPGEVDLICYKDNHLLILEIKSTYLRKTKQDAWVHRTTTLRKAAQQIKRKEIAIQDAIEDDQTLQSQLQLPTQKRDLRIYSWIVDTSIEHDQEMIDGILKVSLEGIIVILNNERYLLSNKFLLENEVDKDDLFPGGFSVQRFVEIVEAGELWSARLSLGKSM